jgi:hypothetical protein
VSHLPCRFNRAHSLQSGLPPLPERRFSRSMLFPVLQLLLLWCTADFSACQGEIFGMIHSFSKASFAADS